MLQINKDKRPKKQKKLFSNEINRKKISDVQENDEIIYRIIICLFDFKVILLFSIMSKIIKDIKEFNLKFEGNYFSTNRFKEQIFSSNHLLFLDSFQGILNKLYNNLEMHNKIKFVLYEIIFNKYVLFLSFVIYIILIIIKPSNYKGKTSYSNRKTKYNDEVTIIVVDKKIKRKNIIIKNISYIRNNIIIIFLILLNLFIQIFPYIKNSLIKFQFSNVTIRIKGTGIKNVFSNNLTLFKSEYYPNIVYINGNKQDIVNHSYYFDHLDNIVELIWNNSIDNCNYIFYKCYNITEIDLSNFDTSQCTSMRGMFNRCTSLTSLDLSSFNTSQVTSMLGM